MDKEIKKWENRYPSEFDHLKFKSPSPGFQMKTIILTIILSGGALQSIIAFFKSISQPLQ